MSAIQIRIDEKTKKSAKKVLDKVGMDMSVAIKVYLKQIVIRQGIPFKLFTENGLTFEEEETIIKASGEAKKGKNIVRTSTWKETKAYLDSLKEKK